MYDLDRIVTQYLPNPAARRIASPRGRLRSFRVLSVVLVVLATSGMQAFAQDSDAGDGWTFTISPYLWTAAIEGKAGTLPGLPPADIDQSFSDIFDDLKFAGMVLGTARKGRFGVSGNVQYVKTSAKSNSLSPLFGGEKLTSESLIVDALGEYAVIQTERSAMRLAAGARVWLVDTELRLSAGVLPGRTINHDETWVDPVVGLNGRFDVASKVFLTGWGYVGGFGVGSDNMADLFGGLGYRFTGAVSGTLGYRWLKVDRQEDDFLYDVRQHGPVAGVSFRF